MSPAAQALAGLRQACRMCRARIWVALALALTLAGCGQQASHPDTAAQQSARAASPRYYLSLGDSLAQGVQPTATGASRPTDTGYPNRIYAVLRAHQSGWQLVKLGCSGETTHTMIDGGICPYPAGSQLAEAERFLRTHRGHIGLITIDIGANDPNSCVRGAESLTSIIACMDASISTTQTDLRAIMAGLRSAAGRGAPIIAMSYYVPELAGWLEGARGREIAVLTERLAAGYNRLLTGIYLHYDTRVANVFAAFHSSDFGQRVRLRGYGPLPRNVATICEWTWACAGPPRGPNEHANITGYGVIATAFLQADPQLADG